MRLRKAAVIGIVLGASWFGFPALADDTNTLEIILKLQRRIDELEQKVKTLESNQLHPAGTNAVQRLDDIDHKVQALEQHQEQQDVSAANAAKATPKISLGAGGFVFSSADENFILKVRGYIQGDGRFYFNDQNNRAADTFLLNRVRPVFEGTVFKNYDFKLMPDFGQGKTVIQDAYLDAHFAPWLSVRAGKFKSPVGLERLQSARDLTFVERAFPTSLAPNRDIGVSLHGDFFGGILNYEAAVLNGASDGGSDDSDESDSKDVAGRLFLQPFKRATVEPLQGLGFGVAGTFGRQDGLAPTYKTIGQQTFFTYSTGVSAHGERQRILPQGYYYWGPFGLLAEYVISSQQLQKGKTAERLDNSAWQVAASVVLTGEKASFTGVVPKHPFAPGQHQWGALELAGRVTGFKADAETFDNFGTAAKPVIFADKTKSPGEATSWGVGLNWYLNQSVKWMLDYEQTWFTGGASGGNRADEKVILSRIQVQF